MKACKFKLSGLLLYARARMLHFCGVDSVGELRVDVLNGFLSNNKARYHRLTGFNALLEITKHMLL